jgi:hypothetical protein
MKGRRPPSRTRDAEIRRFTQTAAARKRRLPLSPSEPAAPAGDAPRPSIAPPAEITGETASPRSSIRPGLRQYNPPTLEQPPQPWLSSGAQNPSLPLRLSEEQEPTAADGESPPAVPPSVDGHQITVASPLAVELIPAQLSAEAHSTVVSPPEPVAGILAASVEPLGMSRIEADYANLLSLAMSLEKMARGEIVRLSNERPNDHYTIESNKKQSDLLSILADGFAKLAAALVEYSKQPQPFFAGKAKEVVDEVAAQFNAWWKANGAQVIDWGIRLPVIIASTGLLGWAGANMTVATTAVSALVGGPNVITAIKKRTKRP